MESTTREFTDSNTVTIAPLGDIQYDGTDQSAALTALKEHLRCMNRIGAFYLGLGDYIDFLSPSNRERLKSANLYDTACAVLDAAAERLLVEMADILVLTYGRWLGMLSGHHLYEYEDGTTSDTRLAKILDTVHLGDCAYVNLHFTQGTHSGSVVIWCHHGGGNGRSITYPLTRLDSVRQEFAGDIYVMGHCSKRGAIPVQRIEPIFYGNSFSLRHREQWLVAGGSFSRGYKEGVRRKGIAVGDYVEKAMMRPMAIGAPVIRITPKWTQGRFDPIIRVEP